MLLASRLRDEQWNETKQAHTQFDLVSLVLGSSCGLMREKDLGESKTVEAGGANFNHIFCEHHLPVFNR